MSGIGMEVATSPWGLQWFAHKTTRFLG
jgi:hypothetical protein